jgi:hypothetical protein
LEGFEKEGDLIGDVSVKNMRCSMEVLFWEAGKLRVRLGKQAHLLDEYLTTLMEAVNRTSAYDAVTEGFQRISELRETCRDVIRGEKRNMDRPFYGQVEDFIGTTPLDCREVSTKISLYTVLLSGNYIEAMAEQFIRKLKSDLLEELELVRLQKLRGELCDELGDSEEVDRIDRLFRQSFMTVSPMACWLQGITDALMGDLISRDLESSKLNFQLLLDGKA